MGCSNCLCEDPLHSVDNSVCGDAGFGNQITKIFVQKLAGLDFDGNGPYTAGSKGGIVSDEADWQLKIALATDDKVLSIPCNGVRPSAKPNVLSGNDGPYGVDVLIDRPQSLALFLTFPSVKTITDINAATCWGRVKVSFLDNNDWLWTFDPTLGIMIPNASVIFDTLNQEGIGTKARVPFEVKWNNLCQPYPVGQFSFLRNLEHVDVTT